MPRLLLVLLALLLPVQFTWSAASVYCQHESSEQARHFGHHVLARKGEPKAAAGARLAPDTDCASCNAAPTPLINSDPQGAALPASAMLAAAPPRLRYISAPACAPDRPQWLCLV